MSVIKSIFLTYLLGTLICSIQAQEEEGSRAFIDHPDKNEYLLAQPGTDKHKYGYELRENKHFHHTTTELDGVRLGCYGYVLDSKKYSTQYVADVRGYRPVYTYDAIEVYPKSGGTREASFVRNFEEDTDRSGNLRYFFPEGCRGFDSLIAPEKNPMTPFIQPQRPFKNGGTSTGLNFVTPPKAPISPPRTPVIPPAITPPRQSSQVSVSVPQPPQVPQVPQVFPPPPQQPPKTVPSKQAKVPEKYLPPNQNNIPSEPIPPPRRYVTKAIPKPTQTVASRFSAPAPVTNKPPPSVSQHNNGGGGCVGCCPDEESMPKIVIPIKLKNGSGKSGSCPSYAKLILPADNVNVNSLKTNPTELAKMVLQSISSQ